MKSAAGVMNWQLQTRPHGITSVQDNSDWEDFLVYEEMEKEGKLNLRISEWLPFKEPLDELKKMRASRQPIPCCIRGC